MEDKELVEGKLGSHGEYDVAFKSGKLVIEVKGDLGLAKAGISLEIGAEQVINAIEKAIPGPIDDVALELLKKALV